MAQTQQMSKTSHQIKSNLLAIAYLVRRLAAEEKLKGGIILPDTAKKKQEQAEVVALGSGKKDKNGTLIPMPVKVGDIVINGKIFRPRNQTWMIEEFVIFKADDLIAIIVQ